MSQLLFGTQHSTENPEGGSDPVERNTTTTTATAPTTSAGEDDGEGPSTGPPRQGVFGVAAGTNNSTVPKNTSGERETEEELLEACSDGNENKQDGLDNTNGDNDDNGGDVLVSPKESALTHNTNTSSAGDAVVVVIVREDSMNNHNTDDTNDDQGDGERRSLHAVYGRRWSVAQTLSLLLNTGMMLYAHLGLTAVFLSNQQRVAGGDGAPPNNATNGNNSLSNWTGGAACTADDYWIWKNGGAVNKSNESNYCAREYVNSNGGNGCLLDHSCTTNCFHTVFNYTENCAACFADVPFCSLQVPGCAQTCQVDGFSEACANCTAGCNLKFQTCTGLPLALIQQQTPNETSANTTTLNKTATTAGVVASAADESNAQICARQQQNVNASAVHYYYTVYELSFFIAVRTAWTSHAKLLAAIVVIFSGLWPYTKNLILFVVWFLPLKDHQRASTLLWLRRLGKSTLVDFYVVVMLMVGVALEISVAGGVPVIIKGEPRGSIIAFLVATIWACLHIEWVTEQHLRILHNVHAKNRSNEPNDDGEPKEQYVFSALRFRTASGQSSVKSCRSLATARLTMWLLLATTIGLFLSGSLLELIQFKSVLGGETVGCVRSYNLYTLGAALVTEFFLQDNTAKPGTWTLYICYVLLAAAIPLLVHTVHVLVFLLNVKSKALCRIADMGWTFASVEVLVLAVFVVQSKFDKFVNALAGKEGSQFFGIKSKLGPGFFILIAYSVFSGLLQYFFNSAATEFYRIDPYHKIDYGWTETFGCILTDDEEVLVKVDER